MTVAALPSKIDYLENGVALSFALPFRFLPGSISVTRVLTDGTVQQLAAGLDFGTSGGGTDAGGTLTLAASVAGATLRIRRATARAQGADYTPGDAFPAESHEAAIDRSMLIDQEQDDKIADTAERALLVPDGETSDSIPPSAERANKYLAFDGVGRPVAAPAVIDLVANAALGIAPGSTDMGSTGGPTLSPGGTAKLWFGELEVALADKADNDLATPTEDGLMPAGDKDKVDTLGLDGGAGIVSWKGAATGEVRRPISIDLPRFNPRRFATGGFDGVANDTPAVQAAIDAAIDNGCGRVELPEIVRLDAPVTISQPNIHLTGKGAGGTRLLLGSATQRGIIFKGPDVRSIEVSNLQAESVSGGQTGGALFSFERHTGGQGCFDVKIHHITTFHMWNVISTEASTQGPSTAFLDIHFTDCVLRDMHNRGVHLTMAAGFKMANFVISYANPQTVAPVAASAGIYLGDWIDGFWICNGNILGGEVCLDMASDWSTNRRKPAQGQFWGVSCDTGWLQSVRLRGMKTCEFHGLITGNLSGSAAPGGVLINGSGATIDGADGVDGARFYGGKDANCLGGGFTVLGKAANIECHGREFVSNGRGSGTGGYNNAYVGAGVSGFRFEGCAFDVDENWFGANKAGYALFIDSGCNEYFLLGNKWNGGKHYSGGLFNNSSGASTKAIDNNL